jgi:hypothetical protein
MALALSDIQDPEVQWDCETTWEDVAVTIGLPKPWIEQLRAHGTPVELGADWGWKTPAKAWKAIRHVDSEHAARNAVWIALVPVINQPIEGYVPPDDFDDELLLSLTALILGKQPDDVFETPMQCADPPWGRSRVLRKVENLEYSTLQIDWKIEALRDRLQYVKERTNKITKNMERKQRRAEEARKQAEDKQALAAMMPVLRVTIVSRERMVGGMHMVIRVQWSEVFARDGTARIKVDGEEFTLKQLCKGSYTAYPLA